MLPESQTVFIFGISVFSSGASLLDASFILFKKIILIPIFARGSEISSYYFSKISNRKSLNELLTVRRAVLFGFICFTVLNH